MGALLALCIDLLTGEKDLCTVIRGEGEEKNECVYACVREEAEIERDKKREREREIERETERERERKSERESVRVRPKF